MRRRLRHRPTTSWLGAGITVVAGILAVVAVVALMHHKSTPTTSNAPSLRLDPGGKLARTGVVGASGQMATSVSAGDYSTCALVRPSIVECWGDDGYGQLGNGDKTGSLIPVKVSLGKPARAVASGGSHACAVLQNGTVDCWGSNIHGELGNGSRSDSPTPAPIPGVRDAAAVAVGVAHTCVLRTNGQVACWGANGNGQLGDGTTTDSTKPVAVTGLTSRVRSIAAGLAHTCATLADGSVDCWGANANGELGDGTVVDSATPVAVSALGGAAVSVDTGDAHTCALLQDGRVQCWGWNIEGQLGNGGGSDSSTPLDVTGLPGTTAIAAGGSHTCALLRSGGVDCWGANLYGQLGNGTTSDSASPVGVTGLQNGVAQITAGLYHSCAILNGGSATCWGWNEHGQLGNRTTTSSPAPVGVARLGLAADGTGSVVVNPRSVSGSARHVTLAFVYTVAAGGIHNGSLAVTVPLGWSLPSLKPHAPGFSAGSPGRTVTAGRTISVTGLTLPAGEQVAVVYGSTAGGGPGAEPHTSGAATWRVREQSSSSGNLSLLAKSPVIHVLSADGSGILATRTTDVPSGAAGRSLTFVFAPAPGGVDNGTLSLDVPAGWSAPSTDAGAPGYVHVSQGDVAISGRRVLVTGVRAAGADRLTIVYGDRTHGGPGAHAPTSAVGAQEWTAQLSASSSGTLKPLVGSPQVNVLSPNGSGRVYGYENTVANGQTGIHLAFTYQADAGGVTRGAVVFTVPAGWSAPSTSKADPGYVTANVPGVAVAGRAITVPLHDLSSGNTVQLTYGAGAGARAPSTNVGPQEWTVRERSVPGAKPKPIAEQPQVNVLSRDGSGRLFRITGPSAPGSSGNTVVYGFQADAGGLQDGTIKLTVPDGWSAPTTDSSQPGYVISTGGSISTSGQAITLTHVYLNSGEVLTVIYGSHSGSGPGAHAPSHPGPNVWHAEEASTAGGSLKPLR